MYHYALPVRCGLSSCAGDSIPSCQDFASEWSASTYPSIIPLGGGNKHIDSLSVIVNNRLVLCPDNTGRSQ